MSGALRFRVLTLLLGFTGVGVLGCIWPSPLGTLGLCERAPAMFEDSGESPNQL